LTELQNNNPITHRPIKFKEEVIMYQALYRKYRPKCFSDVTGQEHITETLRRQIQNDRLSHAYLFVGTRGTGKTTCAKILSRAVNCMNPVEGEPCNKCMFCLGIEDGSILDVLELDAASNNSVDNVRALRDEAIYSPATVNKRVYIVDEVHMLSISAFNALLKILEEPPEHILFILATTELHKVPATIQSRCQKFAFKRLSPTALTARLLYISGSEGFTLTDDAASRLVALADGSMRDGISLLDQCVSGDVVDLVRVQDTLGLVGHQDLLKLIEMVSDRDVQSALSTLDELYNDGRDMTSLLSEMTALVRDVLVFKLSPDSNLLSAGLDKNALSKLSGKFLSERLFFCLDLLKDILFSLSRSGSSKLAVEMCLIKMCEDTSLSAAVNVVNPDEIRGSARSGVPKKVAEKDASSERNKLTVAVIGNGDKEPQAVKTDEPSPCPPPGTDEPSPCTVSPCPDDFWVQTLDLLKSEPSVRVLLNDSSKVQAVLQDRSLTMKFTDSYTADQIEHSFSELIRDAAEKILGHNVILSIQVVESVDSDDSKHSKLDSLSAFDIVNFN